MYAKHPYKANWKLLINQRKSTGLKHYNDFNVFIECSNDIDDIYENIERMRNANGERKVLIIFNGMNADMLSN